MNSVIKKKALFSVLVCLLIYLVDSLADHTWSLSYSTIRTWLLLVLIVVPTFFGQKLRAKRWLMSILFAVLWAVSFPLLAYIMGTEFGLARASLMGVIGFVYTFFQTSKQGV